MFGWKWKVALSLSRSNRHVLLALARGSNSRRERRDLLSHLAPAGRADSSSFDQLTTAKKEEVVVPV
jgi:hypothetical protein